ncbi:hypothetical protein Ancab_004464, partial [Ancistrocladus abbreviatus]
GVSVLKKRKNVDEKGYEMDRIMEDIDAEAVVATTTGSSSIVAGTSRQGPPNSSSEMMR